MTHDELLEEVNKYCEAIVSGQVWTTDIFIKSLRSVVELHKPTEHNQGYCHHCNEVTENDNPFLTVEYPCPTIQAIEKELA